MRTADCGNYVSGQRTGLGVYIFKEKLKSKGEVGEGGRYSGDWLKGNFHGLGTIAYIDGETFQGQWGADFGVQM